MDLLVGFHAKDLQTCQWVVDNVDDTVDNITVKNWVQACRDKLKSFNDGPALVSIGQVVQK